jgi:hypothetical protein
MEFGFYSLVLLVTLFFTYISFSKNSDQTDINKVMAGLLWFLLAGNTFVLTWYIGNSPTLVVYTKNSTYWQTVTAFVYGMIGVSIWVQLVLDRLLRKTEVF